MYIERRLTRSDSYRPNSAVPLSSMQRFSVHQLIVSASLPEICMGSHLLLLSTLFQDTVSISYE